MKADPEIAKINLSEVSSCILCSDGLTDVVASTKAAELLYGSETQRSVPSSSNDTLVMDIKVGETRGHQSGPAVEC